MSSIEDPHTMKERVQLLDQLNGCEVKGVFPDHFESAAQAAL